MVLSQLDACKQKASSGARTRLAEPQILAFLAFSSRVRTNRILGESEHRIRRNPKESESKIRRGAPGPGRRRAQRPGRAWTASPGRSSAATLTSAPPALGEGRAPGALVLRGTFASASAWSTCVNMQTQARPSKLWAMVLRKSLQEAALPVPETLSTLPSCGSLSVCVPRCSTPGASEATVRTLTCRLDPYVGSWLFELGL